MESQEEKAPGAGGQQNLALAVPKRDNECNKPQRIRKGSKIHRVLSALASGHSLNRFDAEREVHDHCLHSTVSAIEQRFLIQVSRQPETVPCLGGAETCRVVRYRLLPDQQEKARRLLGLDEHEVAA